MENLETRLNEVARIAVRLEQETGCPAQLMIAQWAIESAWGAKPVGHANYFGLKRASRHSRWCTVATEEVFTPAQLETWNHQHASNPAKVISAVSDAQLRVEIDDEFADYDSLDDSCQDYAWLITKGEPYQQAWQQYQRNNILTELIARVAWAYATDPAYGSLAVKVANQPNVAAAISTAKAAHTVS
jgi:flagellum-specific peptidoglycan hydrolase FlgJ